MYQHFIPFFPRLLLAVAAGAAIGYIIVPVALHSFSTHMGYILFNYGFAGGLIALAIASVAGAMGYPIRTSNIWSYGVDWRVLAYLLVVCAGLILNGLRLCEWKIHPYFRILRHSGRHRQISFSRTARVLR
jgi:hypothetical protein